MELTGMASATEVAAAVMAAPARCGRTRVLALDGPAGAGKTTLAASVSQILSSHDAPSGTAALSIVTVHADDLYNGWSGPFSTQFAADVHRWILTPVARGEQARHPVYDWAVGRYTSWREFPAPDVLVLEGVGMGVRTLRSDVSVLVWVDAEGVDLLERVVTRDGEQVREPMREFMRRHEVLLSREGTRDAAHLVASGG